MHERKATQGMYACTSTQKECMNVRQHMECIREATQGMHAVEVRGIRLHLTCVTNIYSSYVNVAHRHR